MKLYLPYKLEYIAELNTCFTIRVYVMTYTLSLFVKFKSQLFFQF